MEQARDSSDPRQVIERLRQATDDHDLDALVACFAPDYINETPAHPERSFRGRDQVRTNWEQIFANVADLTATLVRLDTDGDTVWSEWEHRGTRPDGSAHVMRGVVIFGVADGLVAWARFYLEPVVSDGVDVDAAVRQQVAGRSPGTTESGGVG